MAKKSAIGNKVAKIMKEGVRKNTKKPVSKSNPRKPVSQKQAVAIAESMARSGKLGKGAKKKAGPKKFNSAKFEAVRKRHFGLS